MKERQLVIYKKREGASSIFKVLEPIYQKSGSGPNYAPSSHAGSSMRSRFGSMMHSSGGGGKKGNTEFFRDFDDFYIGSETYAINLFHSSLAVATARGMEVLTLDRKKVFTVPELNTPDTAKMAARLSGQKPIGMFRLSDVEFLLVFEEVGIYVNKHGDVSRSVIMEYVGRAKQACMAGSKYLILVDYGGAFVEVRNAINGRLRQVISGRDVRLLDDGGSVGAGGQGGTTAVGGVGTVKVAMQHPEWERSQVVVELLVNEGLKE